MIYLLCNVSVLSSRSTVHTVRCFHHIEAFSTMYVRVRHTDRPAPSTSEQQRACTGRQHLRDMSKTTEESKTTDIIRWHQCTTSVPPQANTSTPIPTHHRTCGTEFQQHLCRTVFLNTTLKHSTWSIQRVNNLSKAVPQLIIHHNTRASHHTSKTPVQLWKHLQHQHLNTAPTQHLHTWKTHPNICTTPSTHRLARPPPTQARPHPHNLSRSQAVHALPSNTQRKSSIRYRHIHIHSPAV